MTRPTAVLVATSTTTTISKAFARIKCHPVHASAQYPRNFASKLLAAAKKRGDVVHTSFKFHMQRTPLQPLAIETPSLIPSEYDEDDPSAGSVKPEKEPPTNVRDEVQAFQNKYPNHVILTQLGGFYEIFEYCNFFEEMATLLNLNIGGRDPKMIGFPIASVSKYVDRIAESGRSVVIVGQTRRDNMSLSKHYIREVSRIVTPGTNIKENVDAAENTFLLALCVIDHGMPVATPSEIEVGIAYTDVSTGEFFTCRCSAENLKSELVRISPKEIIVPKNLPQLIKDTVLSLAESQGYAIALRDSADIDEAAMRFKHFYQKIDPSSALPSRSQSTDSAAKTDVEMLADSFGGTAVITAGGTLLKFINECFPDIDPMFNMPVGYRSSTNCFIDSVTLSALEIVSTIRSGKKKGSLFAELDRTKTGAGSRLLCARLKSPSASIEEINQRLDLIEFFNNEPELLFTIRHELTNFRDIERAVQRMHMKSNRPSDVVSVCSSLRSVGAIKEALTEALTKTDGAGRVPRHQADILMAIIAELEPMHDLVSSIGKMFAADDVPSKITDSGTIQRGFSPELDRLQKELERMIKKKDLLRDELTEKYGVEVSLTEDSKEGPCILVPISKSTSASAARKAKVMDKDPGLRDICRAQKLVTRKKYKHDEWTMLYEEISDCMDRNLKLELQLFAGCCDEIKSRTLKLVSVARAVAQIDIAAAISEIAKERSYVRPVFVEEPISKIIAGRHPVVEMSQLLRSNSFVPNDAVLDENHRCWLVTGPNMGGKSTFLRQCALISVMGQAGLFVPAESATLGVVDRIFSRVGACDDIGENLSTFMVEMIETGHILKHATERSLVIMDEIGRGTSSDDGLALAYAILDRLLKHNRSRTLFATHYRELPELIKKAQNAKANGCDAEGIKYVMSASYEKGDDFAYLYRISDGVAKSSYGIQAAKLAGLPPDVLKVASELKESHQLFALR